MLGLLYGAVHVEEGDFDLDHRQVGVFPYEPGRAAAGDDDVIVLGLYGEIEIQQRLIEVANVYVDADIVEFAGERAE